MITEGQWKRWKDNSTTDDRLNTYVLSDIRQMLGEIDRLNRVHGETERERNYYFKLCAERANEIERLRAMPLQDGSK